MIDALVTKATGFLLNPVEMFRQSKDDGVQAVFTYFCILLLFHAILSAAIMALGMAVMPGFFRMPFGFAFPVMVFFMMLLGGFVCTLVFAAWLHLWVYLLGGRRGIMQTVNAVIYGSTPRLILGWIPFLGVIFMLWSLVLGVLGVRELQELSTGRAILAAVIAIVIPLIVIILIAAWLFVTVRTMSAVPVVADTFVSAY
jgi:hypothetical protein